jgi:hypothetical protein
VIRGTPDVLGKKRHELTRLLLYVLAAFAGLYLLAALIYAIPMLSGVLDDTIEVRFDGPDASIVADYSNGLTPAQKESFRIVG